SGRQRGRRADRVGSAVEPADDLAGRSGAPRDGVGAGSRFAGAVGEGRRRWLRFAPVAATEIVSARAAALTGACDGAPPRPRPRRNAAESRAAHGLWLVCRAGFAGCGTTLR